MNCHHNVGELRRLRELFPDTLVVIGVHSAKFTAEQGTAALRQAVMRLGIDHPVVNDAGFDVWQGYAVRAWPTVVLIDPAGRVVGTQAGEILADELAPLIEQLRPSEGSLPPLELRPEAAQRPATRLAFPAKLLAPGDGRLFVADTGHHRVLELALETNARRAVVQRTFGRGTEGFVDGADDEAAFHAPHGLALAGSRTLYVADTENHAVRAVDLGTGAVRTVAGTGRKAHGRSARGVHPTEVALRSPWDVLAAGDDILLIAMAGSHQVWFLHGEALGVFAGNGREALIDGPRAEASFNQPSGLALVAGHVVVADPEASAIRAISLDEEPRVYTLVGEGLFTWGDRDGRGAAAQLQHPAGVAAGPEAVVFVADSYNHKIKRLDASTGEVLTLFGSGQAGTAVGSFGETRLSEPEGLSYDGQFLYIADTGNHRILVADLAAEQCWELEVGG